MLTKTDLNQIGNVIDEKLNPLKKDIAILKEDTSDLKKDTANVKTDIASLKRDTQYLRRKVNRIDKTLEIVVKNYDEGDVKLAKRVKRIEQRLDLPENN